MVARREESFLKKSAEDCLDKLNRFKQHAKDGLPSERAGSKSRRELLSGVINEVNDNLLSLRAWIKEFSKAVQAQDAQVLGSATTLFQSLYESIDRADGFLKDRLAHRRMRGIGFILHKRHSIESSLNQALQDIGDAIGKLHSVLPLVRSVSDKQADREKRKTQVLENTSKAYKAFLAAFDRIEPTDAKELRTSALRILFEHFPRWPDLEDKAGNPHDPGDGLYYDEVQIAQASNLLDDFHNAWANALSLQSYSPPAIQKMARICLILTGMQQQMLLEDFLDGGYTDANLRFEKEQLKDILQGEHKNYGPTFYTEQIRVQPREWREGTHAQFDEEEPLPLVLAGPPVKGAFGIVVKVTDPWSRETYVRKQQIISSDERDVRAAWEHLKRETDSLKGLDHRHVVQLVKSYQRGRAFGLVMKPAANGDLRSLLDRFKADKFFSREGCRDSVWLRPHFHTAFGCLSHGLAYIHGRKIRHKDIKPGNILFQNSGTSRETRGTSARFLWADFGLAYDFSDSGDSKTRSTKLYSPRYAPPEVVKNSKQSKSMERRHSTLASVSEVLADGEVNLKEEFNMKHISDDEVEAHGRAADVFGLGCVFLEMLSRLVKNDLPLQPNNQEKIMFAEHIDQLTTWASANKDVEEDKALRPLFGVATAMIKEDANQRLHINEVVQSVMEAGKSFACDLCRNEYENEQDAAKKPLRSSATSSAVSPGVGASTSPRPSASRPIFSRVNSAMSSGVRSPRSSRMRFSVSS